MDNTWDWDLLGQAVAARRKWLNLTQQKVASRGGPSTATQRQIEKALSHSYSSDTLTSIDTSLGWRPGVAMSILRRTIPPWSKDVRDLEVWINTQVRDLDRMEGTWHVGAGGDTPSFVGTGSGGQRDLSDLSLEELAEEQRRIADEMTRRFREGG